MSEWGGLWIGLADVIAVDAQAPITGVGAFVNVVAHAENRQLFEQIVAEAAASIHLSLIGVEDVEPLETRLAAYTVDAETMQAAVDARTLRTAVFATFHTYPNFDA